MRLICAAIFCCRHIPVYDSAHEAHWSARSHCVQQTAPRGVRFTANTRNKSLLVHPRVLKSTECRGGSESESSGEGSNTIPAEQTDSPTTGPCPREADCPGESPSPEQGPGTDDSLSTDSEPPKVTRASRVKLWHTQFPQDHARALSPDFLLTFETC